MNDTQWAALGSVAAVVVSALAIAAGLKSVRDQLRLTVFLSYTQRYSSVMSNIPYEARRPGSSYRLEDRPESERILVLEAFREYFNLCSEEIWLRRNRRIDRATWSLWEKGMQQVARFPCSRYVWDELSREYEPYADFQRFMRERVLPYASPPGPAPSTSGPDGARVLVQDDEGAPGP